MEGGGQLAQQLGAAVPRPRQPIEVGRAAAEQALAQSRRAGRARDHRGQLEHHRRGQLPHLLEALLGVDLPLPGEAPLPSADHAARHQRRQRRGTERGAPAVAGEELAGEVTAGGIARVDRTAGEKASDVLGERLGGRVASPRLLRQGLHDDPVEIAPQAAAQRARCDLARRSNRSRRQLLRQRRRRVPAQRVGRLAREQPVQHDPERVHVARRGDRPARELFGGGEVGGERQRLARGVRGVGGGWRRAQQSRDPEVEQLRHTRRRDQDVGGLEIAVDDQVAVRVLHGLAGGADELERAGG